jgi:hypothetical protein
MSSLFGVELPTPVNFVIAFVFVLLLIGAAAWVVRRFGGTRIDPAARGRQPRLAVVDSAAVDTRRKLVIIRRDNVEHLLMIGGPSDVVVETNIVRAAAVAASRDTPAAAPRMPLPDPTPWPLQPEPAPAPAPMAVQPPPPRAERAPRAAPADDAWETQPEHILPTPAIPEVRPEIRATRPADTLADLADEFAQAPEPVAVRPAQVQSPRAGANFSAMTAPQPAPVADQSLAEMAQRLEAALRRPMAQKIVAETQRVTATLDVRAVQPKAVMPPRAERGAAPAVKPQSQQGNLEQEMASLLSRPGKT